MFIFSCEEDGGRASGTPGSWPVVPRSLFPGTAASTASGLFKLRLTATYYIHNIYNAVEKFLTLVRALCVGSVTWECLAHLCGAAGFVCVCYSYSS